MMGRATPYPIDGIVGVRLRPPDGILVDCSCSGGGPDITLDFALADLPAFLLKLRQAAEHGTEQLGQPDRHRFLTISRLEILRAADVLAMVLHLGDTRVPLALTNEQARSVAAALTAHATEPPEASYLN